MRRSRHAIPLSVFLALAGWSCERVISVDLNTASPRTVIEARITDRPGPYTVNVTTTGNYFEPSLIFPPVVGAVVTITDDAGVVDSLQEVSEGIYRTVALQGAVGRMYALRIEAGSMISTGTSTIPPKVLIDSIAAVPMQDPGGKGYQIQVMFRDPAGVTNRYRMVPHINSLPPDSVANGNIFVFTDKLFDGNAVQQRFRVREHAGPGDTVTVDLLSIDEATYEYFRTFGQMLERGPNASATLSNPITSLSGGALGYFAAYAIDSKSIILP